MAIGKRRTDIDRLGKLKWDFEIGKFVLENRVRTDSGWENEQHNVDNSGFRAVFDMIHIQCGWIAYLKGEGLNAVLEPLGQDYGDPPTDKHREGLRLIVKTDETIGGDVRELISTSSAIWNAIDTLHDAYIADVQKHEGCLPAVDVAEVHKETIGNGTILVPVLKIVGWVPRPPELPANGIPLFKRVKKDGAGRNSGEPASGDYTRPKVEDDMDKEIPF